MAMKKAVEETESPVNERSSLIQHSDSNYKTSLPSPIIEAIDDVPTKDSKDDREFPIAIIRAVFPVLLLGVFLANGDGSIVLATNQHIASEFNALSSAAWLLTTYTLASCSSQPLYGKISDIYGRKKNLTFCWTAFAVGCLVVGTGRTYWQVLLGRAISGIGAAGMVALTSIVVADLLPLRYVAKYRAYINFTATMARSIGGPTGGWLSDSIGWRWCFIAQCPLALCGLALVLWKLPENNKSGDTNLKDEVVGGSKLKRVDFLGAFSLVGTIMTCLLALDQGTKGLAWYYLVPICIMFVLFASMFIIVEKRFAKEPVLPLDLISKRDVYTPYLIIGLQAAGQFGLLYGIPIYFQVAAGESVSRAGSRIVPVVIGNATGTILGGNVISKTKKYKWLTVFGICCSITCFTFMCVRWHGQTNWPEACAVYLAGFGMGTSQSTTFVHLAASLDHSDIAIAGTTWFLAQSSGSLIGASFDISLLNAVLRSDLDRGLNGIENKTQIIKSVTSSVESIRTLPHNIQQIVSKAYINSLLYSDGLSIFFVCCALITTLTLKERRLD